MNTSEHGRTAFAVRARSWWVGLMWGISLSTLCACILFPLPNLLLDLGIACSWAIAVGFFTISLNAPALSLPQIPQYLLLMTVGRLGLNIATTRAILSEARAGELVGALGELVMGGSWLVGVSFFMTLTFIQLIVISRGAERIAEVSARFALDALPSAQQALTHALDRDAIHPEDARRARILLRARAELCGALDGAMRFVKGEALASTLLVLMNVFGGVLIGLFHKDVTLEKAWDIYVPLTIGDGLVAQLPALLNTVAIATLVARLPQAYSHPYVKNEHSIEKQIHLAAFASICALLILSISPGWTSWTRFSWLGLGLGILILVKIWYGKRPSDPHQQSPFTLTIHPNIVPIVGGQERLQRSLEQTATMMGLPKRNTFIVLDRRARLEGSYLFSCQDRKLAEGVVVENCYASFVSSPPAGALRVLHPLWGLEGWWRPIQDGWVARSEPSALTQLELICVHCIVARLCDRTESWTLDEVWDRLSEAPESLRSTALNPSLEAITITALFRRLSVSGVDLRSSIACLEGMAESMLKPSIPPEFRLDHIESATRKRLGWERLSWGSRRLSRGLGATLISIEGHSMPLGSFESKLSYILIDLDTQKPWSDETWNEIHHSMRLACSITPEWVILSAPEQRASLEKRLRERAQGVVVLAWDELPPELQIDQLAWVHG